eukprot:scaffold36461_cov60-Phaeocystis_antarctica.AAC.1
MPSSADGAAAAPTQCRSASTPRRRNLSPCRAGGKDLSSRSDSAHAPRHSPGCTSIRSLLSYYSLNVGKP